MKFKKSKIKEDAQFISRQDVEGAEEQFDGDWDSIEYFIDQLIECLKVEKEMIQERRRENEN